MEQERVTFYKPDIQMLFGSEAIQWDGALIKALRYHLKITQTELARMLDVRQQTISEWETGVYMPKRARCWQLTEIARQCRLIPDTDGSPAKDQAPEADAQNH